MRRHKTHNPKRPHHNPTSPPHHHYRSDITQISQISTRAGDVALVHSTSLTPITVARVPVVLPAHPTSWRRTNPNRTEPNRTKPNQSKPNRTKPNPRVYGCRRCGGAVAVRRCGCGGSSGSGAADAREASESPECQAHGHVLATAHPLYASACFPHFTMAFCI